MKRNAKDAAPGPATRARGVAHIAIAVPSIAAARPFFEHTLGLPLLRTEDVPTEGVRVAFFDAGNCHIELLEPLDDDGAVARFLKRRGPGLHHIAFSVADVQQTIHHVAQTAPDALLDETPRPAAGGREAAFLHPRGTFGALIELYDEEA